MTTNHPANGPVSLDRLHQIREILSKAAAQSDGGNLGYAMADAVKVIDGAIAAFGVEPVAWWTGPEPTPTGEIESIHDHETGSHSIPLYPFHNAPPAPVVPDEIQKLKDGRGFKYVKNGIHYSVNYANGWNQCRAATLQAGNHTEKHLDMVGLSGDTNEKGKDGTLINECTMPVTQIKPVADLYGITSPTGSETTFTFDAGEASSFAKGGWTVQEYVELERYQEAVAGNSPVTPDGYVLVPKEITCAMDDAAWEAYHETRSMSDIWAALLAAAPQQEVKLALEHGMQRYASAMQKLSEGDK